MANLPNNKFLKSPGTNAFVANKSNDRYLAFQLVKTLTTPFDQWDAYRAGVIDKAGKVLVQMNQLTPAQQRVWGFYQLAVLNARKMLLRTSSIRSDLGINNAMNIMLKEQVQELVALYEDGEVAVNNAGSGNIAAIGVGPQGEPPGKVKGKRKKSDLPTMPILARKFEVK